jgi:Nuclease-related domain
MHVYGEMMMSVLVFSFGIWLVYSIAKHARVASWFRGNKVTNHLLRLDKRKYKLLQDVVLSSGNGKVHCMDTIIVSPYGIFVLGQQKAYGTISGYEDGEVWHVEREKQKEAIQNPLLENNERIKATQKILRRYPFIPYISIVTFDDKVKVKNIKVHSPHTHVIRANQLMRTIYQYRKIVLSTSEMNEICIRLASSHINHQKIC